MFTKVAKQNLNWLKKIFTFSQISYTDVRTSASLDVILLDYIIQLWPTRITQELYTKPLATRKGKYN